MILTPKVFTVLFQGLAPRQKEVLFGRFGLEGKEPKTLAALGNQYGVTRERIRQIEAHAVSVLGKKIQMNRECQAILVEAKRHLKNAGGVLPVDALHVQLAKSVSGIREGDVQLLREASGAFLFHPESEEEVPFYYSDKASAKLALDLVGKFVKSLRTSKDKILNGEYEAHMASFTKVNQVQVRLVKNYLAISKLLHVNAYGDVGLVEWPEISPHTIRDRIYLVLKKNTEPVHFRTISDLINSAGLGGRKALAATVHNELIKDARFVLVGRGIYGLAERGYMRGTAREVIQKILKEKGPMDFATLVSSVQKERFFKTNTILANLQNRNHFVRGSDGAYGIREA